MGIGEVSLWIGMPLLVGSLLVLLPIRDRLLVRWVALGASMAELGLIVIGWWGFDRGEVGYQKVEVWEWNGKEVMVFGVDGVSMVFVLLTGLLLSICILGEWNMEKPTKDLRQYLGYMLVIEGVLMGLFTVLDMVGFYIAYEAVVIPMYVMVGRYGSRERRVRAAYYFVMYTIVGSVLMLCAIVCVYWQCGTLSMELLREVGGIGDSKVGLLIWGGVFIGLAVKVPLFPLHIWLPEAHVEARTSGSVLLAGVLLKMGTYGMYRFLVVLMPEGTAYFRPMVYMLGILAVVYGSLSALRQTDMKRVIAYGSIGHMGMTVVGLVSGSVEGVEGSIVQMVAHGLASGGLFMCIGVLYVRGHSRNVAYYSGMADTMPILGIYMLVLTMANIGLPGTANFVGEFLMIVGVYQESPLVSVGIGTGMILGGGYSLWLLNRVLFGNVSVVLQDVSRWEFAMLLPVTAMCLVLGVYPELVLEMIRLGVGA